MKNKMNHAASVKPIELIPQITHSVLKKKYWTTKQYSLVDILYYMLFCFLSLVLILLLIYFKNQLFEIILQLQALEHVCSTLQTKQVLLENQIKLKDLKIQHLESLLSSSVPSKQLNVSSVAVSDDLKKFYVQSTGMLLGVLLLCYVVNVNLSAFSPLSYIYKNLRKNLGGFFDYFNDVETFFLDTPDTDCSWMVQVINNERVAILLRTAGFPEYTDATVVFQQLLVDAQINTIINSPQLATNTVQILRIADQAF
jgi:hypothetical protein